MARRMLIGMCCSTISFVAFTSMALGQPPNAKRTPQVPDGFQASVYAADPLVRNPCAMAFDARGRLFVGQGPQYRSPKPDTPPDRVTLLLDSDGDNVADRATTFAEGFNNIQGLAWRGDQLWVANAPDLTVVRDLDGDDQADEYRRIYGGLGNLEHGLHGLTFAPDGRLYMTKGNSRGYQNVNSAERFVAPAPFVDLWGMKFANGGPSEPLQTVFTRDSYQHGYHTPSDDWGAEGGVLRCRPDGSQLEIFSRGMRNMWDMNFDVDFNWVGLDQDQDGGDRILNPFLGAHFGWGHAWSPHWTGEDHPPTAPISGPLFHGSGTGVVCGASPSFPERYRNVFFCADWLNRSIFVYRPKWEGGQMRNMTPPEIFAKAPRGRSMGSSEGLLFDPTDIAFGPDGALWVLSWGHSYGATIRDGKQVDQGRVYRISYGIPQAITMPAKYGLPYSAWTVDQLVEDLRHDRLAVRRTNAQTELIRRGDVVVERLVKQLHQPELPDGAFTWLAWTLAQIKGNGEASLPISRLTALNRRIQLLRIEGYRARRFGLPMSVAINSALKHGEARMRSAAIEVIMESQDAEWVNPLWRLLDRETDRAVFYRARITLANLVDEGRLRDALNSPSNGRRRAALLNLLELAALSGDEVLPLRLDSDPVIVEVAQSFLTKVGTSAAPVLRLERAASSRPSDATIRIITGKIPPGLHVRFTLDGAEPTDTTGVKYKGPFQLKTDATVTAALFRNRERMGPVLSKRFSLALAANPNKVNGLASMVFPVEVRDVRLANGQPYRHDHLIRGGLAYSNRNYAWLAIPQGFVGHAFIQPRNSDKDVGSTGKGFLEFSISERADIFVAHDQRIVDKPGWLDRFRKTQLVASTNDTTYDLFVRTFPAGRIVLGGNTRDGNPGGRSQYICLIKPAPLPAPAVETSVEQALAKLSSASFQRGARLFFNQAACSKCHRMGYLGNALAPDLTNMGTRAAAKTIAESILKPNALIIEGFHTVVVATVQGRVYSGFIKQESGLNVELVQADGKVVTIPKPSIESRRRQQFSVMPEGLGKQLTPQQVADLVHFIRVAGEHPERISRAVLRPSHKPTLPPTQATESPATESPATESPATESPATESPATETKARDASTRITIQDAGGSLAIRYGQRNVATYVYRHKQIRRPFFAHVKAPNGIQLTRNFPPAAGDRPDHADMHPGIWMAFGDLDGEDFWRNKGRVVHERFTVEPYGGVGQGGFSQLKSYRRVNGEVVCFENFACKLRVLDDGYLIVWNSTFTTPPEREFFFGDQEEMGLGVRVATPITELQGGRILDSQGRQGAKLVWSQASSWCDYSGLIKNQPMGITILCHPGNFRGSWMHARNYGLLAANPFGRQAMRKGPRSKVIVKVGQSLRLRYGVFLHGAVGDFNKIHQAYLIAADKP